MPREKPIDHAHDPNPGNFELKVNYHGVEPALVAAEATLRDHGYRVGDPHPSDDATAARLASALDELAELKTAHASMIASFHALGQENTAILDRNATLEAENAALRDENEKLLADERGLRDQREALEEENRGLRDALEGPAAPCPTHPQAATWWHRDGPRCAICGYELAVVPPASPRELALAEYEAEVLRTDNAAFPLEYRAVGLIAEAGEVLDVVKKIVWHKHPFDGSALAKLTEELGDAQWYITSTALAIGSTLDRIMRANVAKLRRRYPHGFTSADSIDRKNG